MTRDKYIENWNRAKAPSGIPYGAIWYGNGGVYIVDKDLHMTLIKRKFLVINNRDSGWLTDTNTYMDAIGMSEEDRVLFKLKWG